MALTAATIDRLKAQLLTSGLSQQNQALFQVINLLIDAVKESLSGVQTITGSGGGGGPLTSTFLTEGDETGSLPNSRQVMAGAGIQLNPSPNGRLVIATALPFNMGEGGEGGEDGPPGPPGQVGPIGPPGPAGSNAVSFMYGYDGEDGEDGLPGITGPQGQAGTTGSAGPPGIPGIDGLDGEPGEDSFIPGPQGLPGATGAQGIQGIQGIPGIPGIDGEDADEPIVIPSAPDVIGGTLTLMRVLADQTINSGAGVFTNITDLTFPVINGRDYAFYFYVVFRSAQTTTGWKASVNHPGGTVDFFHSGSTVANATNLAATFPQRHGVAADDMTLLTSTITANVDLVSIIQGRYKCTANGTFAARFANELAANTDIVVQKGSWGFAF